MTEPILKVQNLSKEFILGKKTFHAVKDVSFSLLPGKILGLGGESGCGKSTIGKLLMRLIQPSSGSIYFEGTDLAQLDSTLSWRRHIQMIFQHPATSLNPRLTIEDSLKEPFVIHSLLNKIERMNRLKTLLGQVGLSEEYLKRLPSELSGGQKQRVAIARALSLEPRLLICDEPFSSLDVSIQAQIINLLAHLHQTMHLTYIIISHDLSILRYLAHDLAIMYLGEIVEWGPSTEVYNHPIHPYTQALISAVLTTNPQKNSSRIFLKEETTKPSQNGCPFAARCPSAQALCRTTKPPLQEIKPSHFVSCHFT